MPTETTYSHARANLKSLLDAVSLGREPIVIRRKSGEDVALIAADELRSLLETVHLFRSPKNAERLRKAYARAKSGKLRSKSLSELRDELGLG